MITEIQAKVLGQCEYFRILMAGAWMRENVVGGWRFFFRGKMRGEGWILGFFGYICRLKLLTSLNFCTHEQDLHHTPQRHAGSPRAGVLAGEGVPVLPRRLQGHDGGAHAVGHHRHQAHCVFCDTALDFLPRLLELEGAQRPGEGAIRARADDGPALSRRHLLTHPER